MSYISEKIAFLDGLAEGLDVGEEKYGKLLRGMIDALGAIAEELEQQNEAIDDISDRVDDICDELDDMADEFDDDDDEDAIIQVKCPHCGEEVYFDLDMLDDEGGLICPNCNAEINFDPEDGCSCGCCEDDGDDEDDD